jgi:Uma2 family endonuclease
VDNSGAEAPRRATLVAMTALPLPAAPLTAAEYAALPELADARCELQEGMIVMAAKPAPDHQDCLLQLAVQLLPQTPATLKTLIDVDIDLQLAPPSQPGTVRAPDLVVVTQASFLRVRRTGGLLTAPDVVLAIEIHSTSSRRTDSVIKHTEYADAGIDHYWMVDLLDGPSITACHRAGELGYANANPVRGVFTTELPFPARIDLDQLQ